MSNFGLKESDFKGKPGYWQRPAKVWRTGVGYVDGYEWGYRADKKKRRRNALSADDLGAMVVEGSRPDIEKNAKKYGWPGEYGTSSRRVSGASAPSIACPTCGFNRMMGRCTCEDEAA